VILGFLLCWCFPLYYLYIVASAKPQPLRTLRQQASNEDASDSSGATCGKLVILVFSTTNFPLIAQHP
jgi:hypothetical protein